jgi:hypothetical protein
MSEEKQSGEKELQGDRVQDSVRGEPKTMDPGQYAILLAVIFSGIATIVAIVLTRPSTQPCPPNTDSDLVRKQEESTFKALTDNFVECSNKALGIDDIHEVVAIRHDADSSLVRALGAFARSIMKVQKDRGSFASGSQAARSRESELELAFALPKMICREQAVLPVSMRIPVKEFKDLVIPLLDSHRKLAIELGGVKLAENYYIRSFVKQHMLETAIKTTDRSLTNFQDIVREAFLDLDSAMYYWSRMQGRSNDNFDCAILGKRLGFAEKLFKLTGDSAFIVQGAECCNLARPILSSFSGQSRYDKAKLAFGVAEALLWFCDFEQSESLITKCLEWCANSGGENQGSRSREVGKFRKECIGLQSALNLLIINRDIGNRPIQRDLSACVIVDSICQVEGLYDYPYWGVLLRLLVDMAEVQTASERSTALRFGWQLAWQQIAEDRLSLQGMADSATASFPRVLSSIVLRAFDEAKDTEIPRVCDYAYRR